MVALTLPFLLVASTLISSGDGIFVGTFSNVFPFYGKEQDDGIWSEKYIESRIKYRLVKKDWKPVSGLKSDKVLSEYPGTTEEAFKAMYNSKYTYVEENLENCEKLFTITDDKGKQIYDKELDSIIIMHPWNSDSEVPFVLATVTAFRLRNLHKKYNVFASELPGLNSNMLKSIIRHTVGLSTKYEPIAQALSLLLLKGIAGGHWRPEQIHLMGFSYSGNLVGYMARYVQLMYRQKIGSIMALDPFSFQQNPDLIHLSRDDAKVVHVYHSCSFVSGTRERIATADFVFNGGITQPECRNSKSITLKINPYSCSHQKSAVRLWYIILYPSTFVVRKCDTWQRFDNCLCEDHDTATLSYPIEKNPAQGVYFMTTSDKKPYGLGEKGSHCEDKKKEEIEKLNESIIQKTKEKINRNKSISIKRR